MLFRRFAALRSVRITRGVPAIARVAPRSSFVRWASNSNSNDFDMSDKESLKIQELVTKLNQNPEIRDILDQFQKLLVAKGFNPNQPPSFMEMMKLFAQKDVRELASKLKNKFDEAGIQISPEDMGLFMKLFKP